MYLHLGQAVVVPTRGVIGIFDLDITSQSARTRAFLERAQREGHLVNVSEDLPRAFVLCQEGQGPPTIYLSQVSSATLYRRAEQHIVE